MLVVIPCGAAKRDRRSAARYLYTGPYFRACLRYALTLTGSRNVLILSALYGLVPLDRAIDPYDLRMGGGGSVGVETVRGQARSLGVCRAVNVTALGGRAYTDICRAVWPCCKTPLTGVGGIGKQLRWLKEKTCTA